MKGIGTPVTDQYVQLALDGPGKKIDTSELTVGLNTVERQRIVLADSTDPAGLARIIGANPNSLDPGLVTRSLLFADNPTLGPMMPHVSNTGGLKVEANGAETLAFKSSGSIAPVLSYPGPALFHWLVLSNTHSTTVFVKLYDLPGAPVLASDVPLLTLPVATAGIETLGFPGRGLEILNTLWIVVTGGSDDSDTTTVPLNVLKGLIGG